MIENLFGWNQFDLALLTTNITNIGDRACHRKAVAGRVQPHASFGAAAPCERAGGSAGCGTMPGAGGGGTLTSSTAGGDSASTTALARPYLMTASISPSVNLGAHSRRDAHDAHATHTYTNSGALHREAPRQNTVVIQRS